MSGVFVTSSGTGVGKTYVTTALIRAARAAGKPARAIKPVISGWEEETAAIAGSDTGRLLAAQGIEATAEAIAACSPYRFKEPLSPDMAAAHEGREIDFDALVSFCRDAVEKSAPDETVFIEGVGGVMVPLTDRHTVLDWIAALDLPVLLVVGSYLGTISHTLTAVQTLRTKHIAVRAVVISESEDNPVPPEETAETIRRHMGAGTVEIVGRGGELTKLLGA